MAAAFVGVGVNDGDDDIRGVTDTLVVVVVDGRTVGLADGRGTQHVILPAEVKNDRLVSLDSQKPSERYP